MRNQTREAVKSALLDQAESLFRDLLGEPERPGAAEWRPKGKASLSCAMRGPKRGQWHDFASGEGGDLLDLVAVYSCGLSKAADNFPAVIDAAARWCGVSAQEVDRSELDRRRAERDRKAQAEAKAEAARKAETVEGIKDRAQPISGTPAEAYLRSRGITAWPDGAVAYLPGKDAALIVWARDAAAHIVGGQRIYINADGTRAVDASGAKKPKKGFGAVSGNPARLKSSCGSGDLYIAEGPETALTIWQETGAEVWAVFGWTGFKAAPVPLDRRVIFCPDRDPQDGPAAKGFKAAVVHHRDAGADAWVALSPEPEGSKRDLNDTLQRAGMEAVREALAAAVKVQPPAAPVIQIGPKLRPVEHQAEILSRDKARERLRAEVWAGLRREGVTLIEATLGLGKTAATVSELSGLIEDARDRGTPDPAAVVAVPMHRLGRQTVDDIKAAAPGLEVVQVYGAEAQDPDDPTKTVCGRLDEYQERAALHLDMEGLCGACPLAAACRHIQSKAARADIYVVSHERLKGTKPIKQGQTLVATVIDENPLNALVTVNRRPLPLANLDASPATIRTNAPAAKRMEAEVDLRAFRDKLAETLTAHGPGYLRLDGLEGWTAGDARAAAKLEWARKITDEADPNLRGNKTISAASAVFGEIERSIAGQIEVNARLRIAEGESGLECVLIGMKPIHPDFHAAPVLMLDATAEPEIAELLAGGALAHRAVIRARENVVIEQDPNLSGAKSFFLTKGEETGNVARVRRFIEWQAMQAETVAIGNKDTVEALSLPDRIKSAHFNALRGLNDFAGADVAVIVGRTLPNPDALARLVGAIWGTPCTGSIQHDGKAWRMVSHGGQIMEAETKAAIHEDPRAETMLRLIRDAEVAQAIGRLRAVNRDTPARCILLSDAVVPYPVKLVELRKTLWVCGIVGEMLERGAAFLSPAHASAAYPDLYATKQAAAKVFNRIPDWATFSIKGLYGKSCPVVTLRRPRATEDGLALVAPAVDDIAGMIESRLNGAKVLKIETPEIRRPVQAEAMPEPVAEDVPKTAPDQIEEAALPDGFRGVGGLVAGLVHKAAAAFVGEQVAQADLRARAVQIVRSLSDARAIRADADAAALFDRAEAMAALINSTMTRPPDPAPVRPKGGAMPQPIAVVAVADPGRKVIWALEADPKPVTLPPILSRYAVTAGTVRKVWDQAAQIIAHAEVVAAQAAINARMEAWQGMTAYDPDAWA